MNGGEVDEIGIQSIDLDVPLYIPGYNLYQTLFWLLTSNGYRIYGDKNRPLKILCRIKIMIFYILDNQTVCINNLFLGLKSADSYFNIESSSRERKHKKKKKKKSKKV